MKKTAITLTVFAMSFAATSAHAVGMMKQGLWEVTTKSDAMKNMPKIPPEQLEKMRQMGIQVPQMSDGGMTIKMCVSKAMSERETPPPNGPAEARSGCEHKNFQHTGNSYSLDIVCDGPQRKGTGTVRGTFTGDTFTSSYDFQGTARGQPANIHGETSGKYLGGDCGTVKPMDEYLKK